jgi:hypothetical protein
MASAAQHGMHGVAKRSLKPIAAELANKRTVIPS